jgi:nucleoside-diphosphate kinase
VASTYLMIKPEAVEAGLQGRIIDFLLANGWKIKRMKMFRFTGEQAAEFYGVHKDKPFFADLMRYIVSSDVIGLELEKEGDVIALTRELVGATDPADARPGTIRYMYGTSLQANAVHASDSPGSAEKELAIVFPED